MLRAAGVMAWIVGVLTLRLRHDYLAIATLGFGALSVVRPSAAESFTGLTAAGPRGISEIRAVLGENALRVLAANDDVTA